VSVTVIANPIDILRERYGAGLLPQSTRDAIPTVWVPRERIRDVLAHLKNDISLPYPMLYDLTAIDNRVQVNRGDAPASDFTVIYHLLSFERNEYIRVKTALDSNALSIDSITDLWPAANWYEREVWDMFGIRFEGHPDLRRILLPEEFTAFPLRKDYPLQGRGERHNFPVLTRNQG